MTFSSSLACSTLTMLVCLLLGACASPEERREEYLAKVGPPQPPLIGKSDYFEGKVSATAYLNPAFRPRPPLGEGEGNGEKSGGRAPKGGMGGMAGGMGGGGGGGGGMRGGSRGGGEGGERMRDGTPPGGGGGRMAQQRQALTVSITNTSDAPITLHVTDVNSALGNFAAVPENATLGPGESIHLEPMRGALANLDELSLKLGLKVGGMNEQQTITLKRVSTE